ncbi:MAG: DNA repair protein RecN [Defluviitaleaceae bacterium]|nr:DNA repair protein RecN [Defluviitaleaceae bacterium]
MLEHLKVSNVALIEECAVHFGGGLNILTGETGAGKSILIDSINFVLGSRVGRDFVRSGAEVASVEAFFAIGNPDVTAKIAEMGVAIEEDGAVFIHRSHTSAGKTTCKINGKTVTIGMLREVAAFLIDIHGQHEHQSLLDPNKHLHLLDRFCQDQLAEPKSALARLISDYKALQKQVESLENQSGISPDQVEFYQFQLEEIQAANLQIDEEEELQKRRDFLKQGEKVEAVARGLADSLGVVSDIGGGLEFARNLASLDSSKEGMLVQLTSLHQQLEVIAKGHQRYLDNLSHDPEELDKIEERLDLLYRLKQKYKKDTSQILEYAGEIQEKLDLIENSEAELARLAEDKKSLEKEIGRTCLLMSKVRKDAATALSAQIEEILHGLGMAAAKFAIDIQRRKEFGARGFDRAEFMISTNKGEDMYPLSKIASGGEMSRTMLALKTALATYDSIETFIFDEIDTGISGRTAQQVAEKLSVISKTHQILCITHLPQIAAMGDVNFLIEKSPQGERTVTHVHKMAANGVIQEIARLIGGAQITDTTISAAEEMRKLAGKT